MPNQEEDLQPKYIRQNVDIVFCIDTTGSMENRSADGKDKFIDIAKKMVVGFREKLEARLLEMDRKLAGLRVKIVAFRDFYCDGDKALDETGFYNLEDEDENAAFIAKVNSLKAEGGGDVPESALEALAIAMKSDWVKEGAKKRHVIILFTDAPAIPLERAAEGTPSNYPAGMPKSLAELSEMWGMSRLPAGAVMDPQAKRLAIFAPDAYPWDDIAASWPGVSDWVPTKAGDGLSDQSMKTIINTIARTI